MKCRLSLLIDELAKDLEDILTSCTNLLGFLTDEEQRLSFAFEVYRRTDIEIPKWVEDTAVLILCVDAVSVKGRESHTQFRFKTSYIKPKSWWRKLHSKGELVENSQEFFKELKSSQPFKRNTELNQESYSPLGRKFG